MPRPRYIICCESRLVEPISGLISHVNVVEILTVKEYEHPALLMADDKDQGKMAQLAMTWTLTAIWMREDSDSADDIYEAQFIDIREGQDDPIVMASNEFRFTTTFWRGEAVMRVGAPKTSKMIRFAHRIRRKGTSEPWLSQEYLIPVDIEKLVKAEDIIAASGDAGL